MILGVGVGREPFWEEGEEREEERFFPLSDLLFSRQIVSNPYQL